MIAVLGHDPFGAVLDETVAGKTVAGRPIQVRRASRVDEVRDAQIVFVSASEGPTPAAILKALERPGLLTVGDVRGLRRARGGHQLHGARRAGCASRSTPSARSRPSSR